MGRFEGGVAFFGEKGSNVAHACQGDADAAIEDVAHFGGLGDDAGYTLGVELRVQGGRGIATQATAGVGSEYLAYLVEFQDAEGMGVYVIEIVLLG